jgi:hypothetical protein
MTRTGYSCYHLRRKTRHGCTASIEHWCSATGKIVDPMSCNRQCRQYSTIAAGYRKKDLADELL